MALEKTLYEIIGITEKGINRCTSGWWSDAKGACIYFAKKYPRFTGFADLLAFSADMAAEGVYIRCRSQPAQMLEAFTSTKEIKEKIKTLSDVKS